MTEPTQEDRDAAKAFWIGYCGGNALAWERLPPANQEYTVQAFARHRIETLERAAEVAEAYDCECDQAPDCFCWNSGVPAAIRNLKGKSDE